MDLDSIGHGLIVRCLIVGRGAREERPLARVVVLVHQVVPGAEGDQVGVVGRRRNRHGARASDVGMAQLVGQHLELVGGEVVVVPKDVVVRWARGTLF